MTETQILNALWTLGLALLLIAVFCAWWEIKGRKDSDD